MIQTNKLVFSIMCVLVLLGLVTACASASPSTPAVEQSTPTPLQFPTNTSEPATAAPATSAPAATAANSAGPEVTGPSLYQLSCEGCHGVDLQGSSFTLDGQTIAVPALTWNDLSPMYQTDPSRGTVEEQVGQSIIKGLDETGEDLNPMMPRWSSLTPAQVNSLVQFLQSGGFASGSVPTLTTDAAGLIGQQLYSAACAACHGQDGTGITFDREGNKIETPSLQWSELTKTYSTDPSRGTVAEQVAGGITKGLDETGGDLNIMMPRWSFLSQAQVDSMVQFLQTNFP